MGKGISLSKVKVGDVLYYNGPGEEQVCVIEVPDTHSDWVETVNRNGCLERVVSGEELFTRKPKKHTVYYPCHLDDVLSNLEVQLMGYIKRVTNTISLVEGAMNV